ncbi:MAG: hypothetical protein M0Z40_12595, partial [Actinomycetota bacterium]|nr:hypothetical protein [Actinomycetota bacterium]
PSRATPSQATPWGSTLAGNALAGNALAGNALGERPRRERPGGTHWGKGSPPLLGAGVVGHLDADRHTTPISRPSCPHVPGASW